MAITYDHKYKSLGQPGAPVFSHRVTYDIGGDNYTTDGLAIDWTDAGLDGELIGKDIIAVVCLGGGGYVGEYDHDNDKLKVFTSNGAAPAALVEAPASALTATFTLLVVAN